MTDAGIIIRLPQAFGENKTTELPLTDKTRTDCEFGKYVEKERRILMNAIERKAAEGEKKHQEMMKTNPVYSSLYEHAQKRASEEKRRTEILNGFGPSGYIPPKGEEKLRELTDEELHIQSILKNY